MRTCSTGKRVYDSVVQAEQALVHLQSKQQFKNGEGPVGVYRCDDCGGYHLTSKGPANPFLASQLRDGSIDRQREANRWIDKLDRK
ncbi:MAG: hypothetical protein QM762_21095 [Chryseolinea sp.]